MLYQTSPNMLWKPLVHYNNVFLEEFDKSVLKCLRIVKILYIT